MLQCQFCKMLFNHSLIINISSCCRLKSLRNLTTTPSVEVREDLTMLHGTVLTLHSAFAFLWTFSPSWILYITVKSLFPPCDQWDIYLSTAFNSGDTPSELRGLCHIHTGTHMAHENGPQHWSRALLALPAVGFESTLCLPCTSQMMIQLVKVF